ncbi:hypothetical protein RJ640_002382 [Escallonia rubra]|uniref:Retrotransposon gag domain-containing protein n=1 Tax=Escallonia rubra TaxID=112253 RepID=A0AA88UN25_9ASTE|nr:hypothetical protein RJ640_002382 [Escallonia rubra]
MTKEDFVADWHKEKEVSSPSKVDSTFPPNMKEAMESDFMRIAQHLNETITEYKEQFMRLSRFASYVVQYESHRARKFREGLRFKIR